MFVITLAMSFYLDSKALPVEKGTIVASREPRG